MARAPRSATSGLRKEVPADATPEQVKNGLTYRELKETSILGRRPLPPGVDGLPQAEDQAGRLHAALGFQPEDGDHAGASMFKNSACSSPPTRTSRATPSNPRQSTNEQQEH